MCALGTDTAIGIALVFPKGPPVGVLGTCVFYFQKAISRKYDTLSPQNQCQKVTKTLLVVGDIVHNVISTTHYEQSQFECSQKIIRILGTLGSSLPFPYKHSQLQPEICSVIGMTSADDAVGI